MWSTRSPTSSARSRTRRCSRFRRTTRRRKKRDRSSGCDETTKLPGLPLQLRGRPFAVMPLELKSPPHRQLLGHITHAIVACLILHGSLDDKPPLSIHERLYLAFRGNRDVAFDPEFSFVDRDRLIDRGKVQHFRL